MFKHPSVLSATCQNLMYNTLNFKIVIYIFLKFGNWKHSFYTFLKKTIAEFSIETNPTIYPKSTNC
jgi:hypothetical protein